MKNKVLDINIYIFLIINSLFYLFGINKLTSISNRATIISIIIGSILSYITISIILSILKNKNIKDSNSKLKYFLLFPYIIILMYSFKVLVNFINYNILNTVNIYMIIISIILTSIYIIRKGFQTIIRSNTIYLFLFLFIFIITISSILSNVNLENLTPIIDTDKMGIIKSTLIYYLLVLSSFSTIFLFNMKLDRKYIKSIKKAYIFSNLFILFYYIIIIGILDINLCNLYIYPEVSILKKVSFFNVIERVESIFCINIFICSFIYFITYFYKIIELINIKKRDIVPFIVSLILIVSYSNMNINNYLFLISNILILLITGITKIRQ